MRTTILLNDYGRLANVIKGNIRKAVGDTAAAIEGDAKQRAPIDTGFLRGSITHTITSDTNATVDVGANYGVFLELGTHRNAAKPYLTPASEAARAPFETAVHKALNP